METIIQNHTPVPAAISDLAGINQLLRQEDLPEVNTTECTNFFYKVVDQGNKIIGAIGLETYGSYGLLRSLVVDKNFRNNGIADKLVTRVMGSARINGLNEVYLLTSTAEQYFLRKGFERRDRKTCPDEIRQSREYSSICPVSSALMSKKTL